VCGKLSVPGTVLHGRGLGTIGYDAELGLRVAVDAEDKSLYRLRYWDSVPRQCIQLLVTSDTDRDDSFLRVSLSSCFLM
jgi:hypothetical protein